MTSLTAIFLAAAGLLWISSLGYLLALEACALLKRRPAPRSAPSLLPSIAIVIPTLNEAGLIGPKLADLERTDYPADLIRVLVVDRGSRDGTDAVVRAEAARDARLRLVSTPEARSKAEQLGAVFLHLDREIAVFTDADAALEPDCLREIAGMFAADPRTALVGAAVRPASRLREERIHWLLLNRIWRLEGEVFSCAGFSGVCYAARPEALRAMDGSVLAEDIHIGLLAGARGLRSRICPAAVATESRVPQTPAEFVRFRRRRGTGYLNEIRSFSGRRAGPPGWRLARGMRLWQIRVTPWLGGAACLAGAALLGAGRWIFPLATGLAFLVPATLYIARLSFRSGERGARIAWGAAAIRYFALMLASLAALKIPPYELGPRGGEPGPAAASARGDAP